jgi:riboflavin kinase/FMN adenylyltransferase
MGHFDGVHRGHRNVIRRAVEQAKHNGLLSGVMTFHPHPKEVLGHGNQYVASLTPLEDKLQLFAELGVDIAYVVRFDLAFASVSPSQFVDHFLKPLEVKHAVVGFDFTFGRKGLGDAKLLGMLGGSFLKVDIVDPLFEEGLKVSSSLIREKLEQGDIEDAEQLLGRPYRISGTVVHGEGRGHTIGFPTANIEPSGHYVLPRLGVYAVKVGIGGNRYPAVLNLGVKPTFHEDGMTPKLEAHLFDFDRDLYGEAAEIDFFRFLRPERKFDSVSELIEQIGRDAVQAKTYFAASTEQFSAGE